MVLVELLEFGKVILAIMVWCYVYFFLKKSEHYHERRPWEYLYIGCMALFVYELISFLRVFRGGQYTAEFFIQAQDVAELAFLGFLFFAFLSQHNLLLREKLIVIAEKRPHTGLRAELREREADEEEVEEELKEVDREVKEEERIEEEIEDVVPDMPQKDPERTKTEALAQQLIAESEKLLASAQGIDEMKAGLFRDQLEDLKASLADPTISTNDLKRKIMVVMKDS